jgi:transmembrane sensor
MTNSNASVFDRLLQGYLHQSLTDEEITVFFELLQQPENQLRLQEVFDDDIRAGHFKGITSKEQAEAAFQKLAGNIRQPAPVRRLWIRWVAAAGILFVIGSLWLVVDRWRGRSTPGQQQAAAVQDVAPGGDKAVLTLADGSTILLDSAGNGLIAQQGATGIRKIGGQIVYDASHSPLTTDHSPVYNTMSTPRGGQYQLTLPDGSRVWLNAASSITYPTAFTGDERRVHITGEVYFEVASLPLTPSGGGGINGKMPFIVSIDGKAEVEVLGTHFNINSYSDDESIKTTLLEGKVKVVNRESATGNGGSIILKPGEQAIAVSHSPLTIDHSPDIDKVMAWKNGFFNFEGASLTEVMKQLERWYDITVVYEKGVPNIEFFGEISRKVSLADLVNVLKDVGVHFRIEAGRKLVVLP